MKSIGSFRLRQIRLYARSLDQILKKPCVHDIGYIFDQIVMKLSQNVYLYEILARFECESSKIVVTDGLRLMLVGDSKLTNIGKYAVCNQRNDKSQCATRGKMALHILINFFISVSNKTIIRSSLSVFSNVFLCGQDRC